MNAPVLVIPENIYEKNAACIKLDLGTLKINSKLVEYKKDQKYN